jgi:hypothetical protein
MCTRPWVQSSAQKKEIKILNKIKKKERGREEKIL